MISLGPRVSSLFIVCAFSAIKETRDGPTDQRTNGPKDWRMDKPSYTDAWTHLKTTLIANFGNFGPIWLKVSGEL